MELAARLHSSHSPYLSVKPFFSDQSHLVFYGSSSSTQCKPIIPLLHTKFAASSSPPLASLRTLQPPLQSTRHPSLCASSAFDMVSSIPSELDLLKELSLLKAQVKLKKKQLKALAKEKKTAPAPERKKMKSKGGSSSSSSSSSSSESSDGGSMAVNMRLLKKDLKQGVSVSGELHGLPVDVDHTEYRNEGNTQFMPSRYEAHELYARAERAYSQSTNPVQGFRDEAIAAQSFQDDPSRGALATGHARAISGSIEVCMGGKCKKAGSEQLLSSFKAQIPASACVDAVPCKCMGKCGSTINVKVQKEDTNPQHHSHVSVDDAGLILGHHFGLGPPLSGLPCFSSLSPSFSPSIFTAQV